MANHKSGENIFCPQCGREFYIIKSRLNKDCSNCCSLKCSSQYTSKKRALKLSKKHYPFISGICLKCGKDIVIKNSGFDKVNRKFCSNSCKNSFNNHNRVWKQSSKDKVGNANRGTKRTLDQRMALSKSVKKRVSDGLHNTWKGGIMDANLKIRASLEYKLWREAVFARDGFTCQKYGTWGGELRAHHIQNFSKFPELRFTIDNGITMSNKAHKEFHKKYGRYNNTKEQIEEFLKVVN